MPRPVILTLAGRYLPGFKGGGPVRSIANLVDALGDEFEFRIVAYDRDLGDAEPYGIAKYGAWQEMGKALVWWIRPGSNAGSLTRALLSESKHDLLYVNSFFDPVFGFGALSRQSCPTLLAPRGQFGLGAMHIGSFKKKALISFLALKGDLRPLSWQATDDSEIEDILRVIPSVERNAIFLAANLAEAPPESLESRTSKRSGELKICFLSRISPKKNLDGSIRMVSKLQGKITFEVYGPLEDVAYAKDCLDALNRLAGNISATYRGSVAHEDVRRVLGSSDVMLLPTLGENFGHAIYEALTVGTPIVVGDRTPWRELEKRKAGFDLPVEQEDRFASALQSFVEMDSIEFESWSRGAWLLASSYHESSKAVEASRAMFRSLATPKS